MEKQLEIEYKLEKAKREYEKELCELFSTLITLAFIASCAFLIFIF